MNDIEEVFVTRAQVEAKVGQLQAAEVYIVSWFSLWECLTWMGSCNLFLIFVQLCLDIPCRGFEIFLRAYQLNPVLKWRMDVSWMVFGGEKHADFLSRQIPDDI